MRSVLEESRASERERKEKWRTMMDEEEERRKEGRKKHVSGAWVVYDIDRRAAPLPVDASSV